MADAAPAQPKRGRGRPRKTEPATAPPASELGQVPGSAGDGAIPPVGTTPAGGDAPPADRPPRAAGKRERRGRPSKAATTKAIADALAELLALPAIPFAVLGDEFCADHFTTQSRELGARIAQQSERNPTLRRWCERAMDGESIAVLMMGFVMYALPPLIHHNAIPGADGMRGIFNVPAPAPAFGPSPAAAGGVPHAHQHNHAAAGADGLNGNGAPAQSPTDAA